MGEEEVQHLTEHNKCLQHQVCKLKDDLIKKANQFSCPCHAKPGMSRSNVNKGPPPSKTCSKCKNHLCRLGSGRKVRFEEELDLSAIHLCSHIACLQRQVCHLKMQLHQVDKKTNAVTGSKNLVAAEAEIAKLETKCDKLLDQKKAQLEKISQLQKQIETLLHKSNIDRQVQDLILDLESQRDNYKFQVQNLIKDLKSGDRKIKVQDVETGIINEEQNVCKTSIPETRHAFQLPSNIRRKVVTSVDSQHLNRPVPVVEDGDLALELLETKTNLADKAAELDRVNLEVSKLRQELDSCLAQLENYRVKQTQTSPRPEKINYEGKLRKELEIKEKEIEKERNRLDKWKD